jgi:L-2-hydroxyglutarate oxidase LhgO
MDSIDCVVVGAGVIGLAIARVLALAGREVIIAEASDAIGTQTSSRNSEVIHAGIYYAPGSLMARFCVAGKHSLYAYCRERIIPFKNCGKLIVATDASEANNLATIGGRAAVNGVTNLELLTANQAIALEPELFCTGALLSPSTGIIDSHAFMLSLQADAEAAGAVLVFMSPVAGGQAENGGVVLEIDGSEQTEIFCRLVINSAGLGAPALARKIRGIRTAAIPPLYLAKGNYFALTGRSPFERLIYPVPVPGGLGTHLTLDMGGNARFGPDVEWIDTIDYSVNPHRVNQFYRAVRRYWPDLQDGRLQPGYSGIRSKTMPSGSGGQDFIIQDWRSHGVIGLINLFGIESPGLTAALAIADEVLEISRSA